jgi:hypothetical protein
VREGGVSRQACPKKSLRLAVEFPSPCDRSAIADCRRSVFAGLDKENSGPLRRNAISTAKLSPKRLGSLLASLLESPSGVRTTARAVGIQSQNRVHLFGSVRF